MLHPVDNATTIITILGIDPGSMFTGIAVIDISYPGYEIVSITSTTIDLSNMLPKNNSFDNYTNRVISLGEQLSQILEHFNPSDIVMESPFFNRLRPIAYGVLRETFFVLKKAIYDYNKNIFFSTFAPSSIKIGVGGGFKDTKEEVYDAILNNKMLKNYKKELKSYNEHEIDAVGAIITYIKHLKYNEELLCM